MEREDQYNEYEEPKKTVRIPKKDGTFVEFKAKKSGVKPKKKSFFI